MPYATNGAVATDAQPGWIEITPAQYTQAIEGMMAGRVVTVDGGFAVVDPPKPVEPAPPPLDMSLDAVKSRQHATISMAFSSAAQTLTAGYPAAEQLTWPTQQTEALAWEANNSAPTPYLDSIAETRGIDPREMRTLTVNQVHAFQTASAQLVGKRQRLRDQIDAVTDATPDAVSVVQAIVW